MAEGTPRSISTARTERGAGSLPRVDRRLPGELNTTPQLSAGCHVDTKPHAKGYGPGKVSI
jgi:hypothetical protein